MPVYICARGAAAALMGVAVLMAAVVGLTVISVTVGSDAHADTGGPGVEEGMIVVSDQQNGSIKAFHPDGTFAFAFNSSAPQRGGWNNMYSIAVAPDGSIVAGGENSTIWIFRPDGTFDFMFGSEGRGPGQFRGSLSVDVAPDGRIVAGDSHNNRIQVFHPDGTLDFEFGTRGDGGGLHSYGPYASSYGSTVAVAPDGRIVAGISDQYRIHVFHPDGTFDFGFGSRSRTADAPGGQFSAVTHVAVAPDGRILAADLFHHRVQVFHPNGTFDFMFGSEGRGPGQFPGGPVDIAVAPDGRIAVADSGRLPTVQVFHPNGTFDFDLGGSEGDWPAEPLARLPAGIRALDIAPVLSPPPPPPPPADPNGTVVAPPPPPPPLVNVTTITYSNGTLVHSNGTVSYQPPVVAPPPANDTVAPMPPVAAPPPANGPGIAPHPPRNMTVHVGPGGAAAASDGPIDAAHAGHGLRLVLNVTGLAVSGNSNNNDNISAGIGGTSGNNATLTFPPDDETVVVTSFARVTFPAGATAVSAPDDGLLSVHVSSGAHDDDHVQDALGYNGSGTIVLRTVVRVGDEDGRLHFDLPVRILLEGHAGGRAFYAAGENGTIVPIDRICAADDTDRVHRQLGGSGECQIDTDDGDKAIHTYHMTLFGTGVAETGAPPPSFHTCSVRLGSPGLEVEAAPGAPSPAAPQALINSGSMPFAGVGISATPWRVAAGAPSLPANLTEVSADGRDSGYRAVGGDGDGEAEIAAARGLAGGHGLPLWFRIDLTDHVEVQGAELVQNATYSVRCDAGGSGSGGP